MSYRYPSLGQNRMTIDELPTFAVDAIARDRVTGSFADARWLGNGYIGYLITTHERLVSGRFVTVDLIQKIATFVPDDMKELAQFQAGNKYHRIDGYWGERAELVLGFNRSWAERRFEPGDAVRYPSGAGYVLVRASNHTSPPGSDNVKGAWDHEHCEICWAKISPQTDPIGVFSEPDHWVCRECYAKYVVPRSLDFIGEG